MMMMMINYSWTTHYIIRNETLKGNLLAGITDAGATVALLVPTNSINSEFFGTSI